MRFKYFILIIFSTYLFSDSGGYVGASYRYGSNARSIALSNSLVSSYNTGYNPLTNPALLGQSFSKTEYGFSYFPMSFDRSIKTLSATIPLPLSASIGFSLFTTSVDDIKGTNSSGGYTGLYNAWEGYGMLSFGLELSKLSAGINMKILKSEIDTYSSENGIGIDVGFLYKLSPESQIGLLIDNLSTQYTWDVGSLYEEKFPTIFSIGYSLIINEKILSLYQLDYSDELFVFKFGAELDMMKMKNIPMDIRFGLNNKNDSFNPSFGFGYNLIINKNLNFGIDYALDLGVADEGLSHLFSLTFNKQ
ncbi:MAG: hypothetical protein CMG66_05995 [Candidatus Marinimicrobia bacterium]|nr:hypothetical protein [Candidatus Neomarinimicrobiota bacterium]|tara:strand:- start:3015 stop:3929 length:915 start_codon:yes stop_codon:yes gene_type:complete